MALSDKKTQNNEKKEGKEGERRRKRREGELILLNTLGKIYRKCAVSSGALAERQELHISVKRAERTHIS